MNKTDLSQVHPILRRPLLDLHSKILDKPPETRKKLIVEYVDIITLLREGTWERQVET